MSTLNLLGDPSWSGRGDRVPDLVAYLGEGRWQRLPPATRQRFAGARDLDVRGVMRVAYLSPLGHVLAQVCRLIGSPIATVVGRNLPTEVDIRHRPDGVSWRRRYRTSAGRVSTASSVKALSARGELVERLGCGLCMRLALRVMHGRLHFVSKGYCWRFLSLELSWPTWLPPGRTHVMHEDLGRGRFRFVLRIKHRRFGVLGFQDGVFTAREVDHE